MSCRCLHTSSPLSASQSSRAHWHSALSTDTALFNFALTSVVYAFPDRCLLSPHIPNAVCTHPLRSQPINRRKPSRSLPHVLSLSLSVSFLNVFCPLPERLSAHLLLMSTHNPCTDLAWVIRDWTESSVGFVNRMFGDQMRACEFKLCGSCFFESSSDVKATTWITTF